MRLVLGTVAVLALLISTGLAVADSPAMPKPLVFASPEGSHYFRLVPSPDFNEAKAEGYLFRVDADADELIYKTRGWYSFTVLVANGGRGLVRTGPWPSHGQPPESTPALVFYFDGTESRVFTVADLVKDLSALEHSMSHYSWGGSLRWANGGWDGLVQVDTVEGQTIVFDIESAEIVK